MSNFMLNNLKGKEVTFFPYRTARVKNHMFEFRADDETSEKSYRHMQERLAKKTTKKYDSCKKEFIQVNGVELDNHICFRVGEYAIMFSDYRLYIGLELEML